MNYFGNLCWEQNHALRSTSWKARFWRVLRRILVTRREHKRLPSLPNLQFLHFLISLTEVVWFTRWLPAKHCQVLGKWGRATRVALVSVCSQTGCFWQMWKANQSSNHLTLKEHSLRATKFVLSDVMAKSQGSSVWSAQLIAEWVFGGLGMQLGFVIIWPFVI